MDYDFLLEKRLMKEAPDLHRRVADSAVILQQMLLSFLTWFPDFTDHSILHSLSVIDFCNQLLGKQVNSLSIGECYVLLMSCYLHDSGMGIPKESFEEFSKGLDTSEYEKEHHNATIKERVRAFHNEYSGLFIKKYHSLFDIPSDDLLFAIVQVSRGHRKTNLYDENVYPDLETEYGIIRTAYLGAILRLADEIDVGMDRNPELLFDKSNLPDQNAINYFGMHDSIKEVEILEDKIVLHVKPKSDYFIPLIEDLAVKIQTTLDYCVDVADVRSSLKIYQKTIELLYMNA